MFEMRWCFIICKYIGPEEDMRAAGILTSRKNTISHFVLLHDYSTPCNSDDHKLGHDLIK